MKYLFEENVTVMMEKKEIWKDSAILLVVPLKKDLMEDVCAWMDIIREFMAHVFLLSALQVLNGIWSKENAEQCARVSMKYKSMENVYV